jgi:glutamate/aspartate transport system substrate-binding protein
MKVLTLMSLALLSVGLVTVRSTADAQTLKKISESNKVTVSYRESAVPFSYLISPTKAVGFAVDITEAIVDDIKTELKKPYLQVVQIPVNAQSRIPKLIDGTYDLECGSTTNTSARGKEVAFAINHFYTGTRLLVQKSSNINNYADLQNKTVASIAGSTNEKVLKKYADDKGLSVQIVYGKDYAEAMKLVEDGKAAAFAMDDVLLFGLMANSKQSSALAVVGDTLQVEPYGCMVRKGDVAFKKLVDRSITRLMKTGEFSAMYARWFESPIPPNSVNLAMPMSQALRANLKQRSDQPAL